MMNMMNRILLSQILATGLLSATIVSAENIKLPAPRSDGGMPLEAAMAKRRSVREFKPESISIRELSQLLWAAQGVTGPKGQRTAPSAMAKYPLSIYIVPARVDGLAPGLYRYKADGHELETVGPDKRAAVLETVPKQTALQQAAVVFIVAMNYQKSAQNVTEQTRRYVHMETGLAAQNLLLEAVALKLGSVVVGGINAEAVRKAANLPEAEEVMCALPVGRPMVSE
jgi:SagB-type dehydrogenase family enzyme